MKTPYGTEVDLGPGHIVLDRDPAPPRKRHNTPSFRPMFIVATVAHLSYCWALVHLFTCAPYWITLAEHCSGAAYLRRNLSGDEITNVNFLSYGDVFNHFYTSVPWKLPNSVK